MPITRSNHNKRGVQESVIDFPKVNEFQNPGTSFTLNMAESADSFTKWGKNVRKRDEELRAFWPSESFLAGAVGSVCIRNSAYTWQLEGPPKTVTAVDYMLNNAITVGGTGWMTFINALSQDLYCLAGKTRISLGGSRRGQTKTIAQMVKHKDRGPVLSMDENGFVVERPVMEWHKTPLGDRKWYWLSLKNSQHSGKRRGGLFLTEDHPMLTDRGWTQAKDIKITDKVATKDPNPSEQQMQLIIGGLLGDMSMSKLTKRSMIRFAHSEKQESYMKHKMKSLVGFEWTGYNKSEQTGFGATTNKVGVNSKVSLGLNETRNKWYPSGKKIVCREDIEKYFSPIMMAIWYMDDGSKQTCKTTAGNDCNHAMLCTDGFTVEDVEWLIDFLNKNNLDCKLQISNGYPRIRFSAYGYRNLVELIAPYIIPEMRYKLPSGAAQFNQGVWNISPATVYFDEVYAIEQRDYKSGNTVTKTTYHIGVEETRNFVAAGMISHNTTDNGGFVEIIRKDEKSPVLGIAHLDSARCIRTSDPLYPVLYRDRKEKIHKMPWYNVISYADMPSPIQTMHGVGVSAVTRVLRSAQILRDIAQYKHEKVSGQFYRAIHFVGGVAKSEIDDVEKRGLEQAQNKGMVRYIMPLIIASLDPEKPVSSETIELASLPDNFNIDEEMKWYISSLALGFGVDYQDFAPLPGGNLGAGSQSEILHRKSRGKGPAWFMDMIVNSFKWRGVIPRNIEFNFVEQDLAAESDEAKLRKSRAEERAIRIQSGEIDLDTARILAERAGDMEGITISSIKDPEPDALTGGIGGSAGGRVQGTDNGNRDEK